MTDDFKVIRRMTSLQAQHCLATGAVQHRINHLLRMIPGGEVADYGDIMEAYDNALLDLPRGMVRRLSLPDHAAGLVSLPLSSGGAGLPTVEVTCGLRFPRVLHAHSPPLPQAVPGPGSPRPTDPGPRPGDGHAATTTLSPGRLGSSSFRSDHCLDPFGARSAHGRGTRPPARAERTLGHRDRSGDPEGGLSHPRLGQAKPAAPHGALPLQLRRRRHPRHGPLRPCNHALKRNL